jgi:hypothetical protein
VSPHDAVPSCPSAPCPSTKDYPHDEDYSVLSDVRPLLSGAVPRMPAPLPTVAVPSRQPLALPLAYTDVHVNNFCNLIQGSARRRRVV